LRRASEIIRNDLDNLTGTTLQHVATLATPHMRAILNEVTAAFPRQSDAMFTTAIAAYLTALLAELAPAHRAREIDHINLFLTTMGYKLIKLSSPAAEPALAPHQSKDSPSDGGSPSIRTRPCTRNRRSFGPAILPGNSVVCRGGNAISPSAPSSISSGSLVRLVAVVLKGTPEERKAYLGAATRASMKDPELVAEYLKAGVYFDPIFFEKHHGGNHAQGRAVAMRTSNFLRDASLSARSRPGRLSRPFAPEMPASS
jgi:hypothetical protein